MTSCKPSSTPFTSTSCLTPTQGQPLSDPTPFRSLVGALQYLTFTRPDLSFAVNQVCQFMHNPIDVHLMAAKRILRYLRGTLHRGFLFRPSSLQLQAYADVDWAGDPVDLHRAILFSLDQHPLLGSPRSSVLSHALRRKLSIVALPAPPLSSIGFGWCFVIWGFSCPILPFFGAITSRPLPWLQISCSMPVQSTSKWIITLCVRK